MEKNTKAKKLLYFGLGPDEHTRISECDQPKKFEMLSKQLMKEQIR